MHIHKCGEKIGGLAPPKPLMTAAYDPHYVRRDVAISTLHILCESKQVAPLKLLAIFSLKLSIFP